MILGLIFLCVVVGLLVIITCKVCSINDKLQQLKEKRYYVDAPEEQEVVGSKDGDGVMVDKVNVTHIIEEEPSERDMIEEGQGETNHRDRLQKLEERIEVVLESRVNNKSRPRQELTILTHIANEVQRAKDLRRQVERRVAQDLCLSTTENEEEESEVSDSNSPPAGLRASARLRSKRLRTARTDSQGKNNFSPSADQE
ncbi:hypothetical protein Pcinc_012417 [Petrolisthes cinctipes]|uniref:Uncharacterized protein n=1 Tax=Petrolisthes cinctipes TaxID=88211 RepID=A0AAE1FZ10_PETCI|nr:hypothetical protein Pcinc_012417 [Petrolisthes cinctipes]